MLLQHGDPPGPCPASWHTAVRQLALRRSILRHGVHLNQDQYVLVHQAGHLNHSRCGLHVTQHLLAAGVRPSQWARGDGSGGSGGGGVGVGVRM